MQLSSDVITSNGSVAVSAPVPPPTKSSTSSPPTLRCVACDLDCSSTEQLLAHLSGKRHAKRCKSVTIKQSVRKQPEGLAPPKAPKRRTFFRLPKHFPETSPEVLLHMEDALPLTRVSDALADLPFCTLSGNVQTISEEPAVKRPRSDLKSDQPSDRISDSVDTRFCGHLNCVLGRATKVSFL
ncbi:hypothetical protein FBUS_08876 [Fasciolopsis buskii]|uniref:Zinc finger double-stranded RNA binding domain-containing protein n=1 Tax=Fasciolopsis buskii TaxID=27845 RepID=A0A8E0RNP3_9TREM|nr:hypothetical protein FBUS_08876 [Fasciolopsis buski]